MRAFNLLVLVALVFACGAVADKPSVFDDPDEDDDEEEEDSPGNIDPNTGQPQRLSLEQARGLLEEAKAAFNTRENKKKLRALMKQTEGQDMMQKMGSVMPVVQEIQKEVMDKYGFDSVMQAVGAVQQYAQQDKDLAKGISELQSKLMGSGLDGGVELDEALEASIGELATAMKGGDDGYEGVNGARTTLHTILATVKDATHKKTLTKVTTKGAEWATTEYARLSRMLRGKMSDEKREKMEERHAVIGLFHELHTEAHSEL